MRFTRGKIGIVAAGAVGAAASVMIAVPGFAASSFCSISSGGTCQTSAIAANRSGRYVKYSVCPGGIFNSVAYEIVDVNNGVVVKRGSKSSLGCTSGQVNGLYSSYRLKLGGSNGANGTISN